MLRGTFYSSVLHALVVVLAAFGLPQTQAEMRDLPEIPITVLTVDEFTALSRPKPEAEPQKPPTNPKRPTPAPPEIKPLKTVPPKTPPPETPSPKIKQTAPVLRPETRPSPKPPQLPEPKPSQKRVETTPAPQHEPETSAETKKAKPEQKPDFLTSVLKTLEKRNQQPPSESQDTDTPLEKERPQPNRPSSTQPMTISELDVVRRQFIACWNVPVGARAADDLSVQVRVHVNLDGVVYESYLLNPQRAQTDSFYRAAAESALRAVRNPRCNPLKLPAGKYDHWKVMTLNFDPQEMFD